MNKKFILSLICGICLSLSIVVFSSFFSECNSFSNEILRVHIPANSNSAYDQEIKLKVKESITQKLDDILKNAENLDEAKKIVTQNIDTLETIAKNTLKENNVNQNVSVNVRENVFINTRKYMGLTVPSGRYTAVTVELGKAQGDNWWCIAYPQELSDDCSLTKLNSNYKIAFAGVEILERFLNIINKPSYKLTH